MATKTQVISNYQFQLPSQLQLSSQGAGHLGITLPENKTTSSASLQDRVQPLSEVWKSFDLGAVESFAQLPIKGTSSPEEPPFLTSGATSTEDNIANISYFIRTLMPEAASTQAIGVTTGENVFQGFWAAYKAANRFKQSQAIGDKGGMVEGGLDAVRGVTQSLGGLSYLGFRGTMIAADIHHIDATISATTPLGKAAFGLGMIGNILFTLFYIFIAAWSAHGLYDDLKFSAAMKAHERGDAEMFQYLMGKVIASPKGKLEKLTAYWNTLPQDKKGKKIHSFKEGLKKSALSGLAEHFVQTQSALLEAGETSGRKPLSKTEAKKVLEDLFAAKDAQLRMGSAYAQYLSTLGLSPGDVSAFDFSMLELIGFSLEENNRQCKKDAKFSRVTDDVCTAEVKKAASRGLSVRLESSDPLVKAGAHTQMVELEGRVTAANNKSQIIHKALLVVGILGIAASILGFIALPPAGMIALTVVTLLLCIGMMATDSYSMVSGLNDGPPGKHDKTYLLIIGAVIILALAVSIAVTLTLGLPILPLILAGVIAGMGIVLIGYSYYKLVQKEKKWIADHPELEAFKEFLDSQLAPQDEPLDEKVNALFKKLPKDTRKAVREKYFALSRVDEAKFKLDPYRTLDGNFDFGAAYLFTQITPQAMSNEREHTMLLRALKKTTKLYWANWYLTKTEENKQIALKIQSLYESVAQKSMADINLKIFDIMQNREAYVEMKKNVWYVAKRGESKADLKKAVDAVISDRVQAKASGVIPAVTEPLIQRVSDVYALHHLGSAAA